MIAAQGLHADVVRALIRGNADPRAKTEHGNTALIFALTDTIPETLAPRRLDVVRALIAANADVNARGTYGFTALMLGAATGDINDVDVVRALLDAGADVNAKSETGLTPLDFASRHKDHREVAALLNAARVRSWLLRGMIGLLLLAVVLLYLKRRRHAFDERSRNAALAK